MKLYIIIDKALEAGLYAAQAVHAAFLYGQTYPDEFQDWYDNSNNIVILEHEDIPSLAELLEGLDLNLVRFHEPDRDDALTAICVEPAGKRHLSSLRLAS